MSRTNLGQDLVWQALGPFPNGTREDDLPCELYQHHNFDSLPYDESARFPSSILPGGQAGWTQIRSTHEGLLKVSYPSCDWKAQRLSAGWCERSSRVWLTQSHDMQLRFSILCFYVLRWRCQSAEHTVCTLAHATSLRLTVAHMAEIRTATGLRLIRMSYTCRLVLICSLLKV